MTWRGAYAGGTTYALNDGVTSGGSSYRSLAGANTGHTPASSPTWWELLAAAGAPGVPGPAPTGTGYPHVTGDVLDPAAQSAATVRAALDASRRTTDAAPGVTGWTLTQGAAGPPAATVQATSGVLRFTYEAGATGDVGVAVTAPTATRALDCGWDWQVTVRIAALTDADGYTRVNLDVESATRTYAVGAYAEPARSGSANAAVYYTSSAYPLIASEAPLAAGRWLRLRCLGGYLAVFVGQGADLASAAWSRVGGAEWPIPTVASAPPTVLRLSVGQPNPSASDITVDLDDVVVDDLRAVAG